MPHRWTTLALAAGLAWCGIARAQVDLSVLDDRMAGPRAEVMVLGTVHIGQMEGDFGTMAMAPLLDRLAALRFGIDDIRKIESATVAQ